MGKEAQKSRTKAICEAQSFNQTNLEVKHKNF